jgi:membrane-bound serine protease (ClpP class)
MKRKIRRSAAVFLVTALFFLFPAPLFAFVLAASLEGTVGIAMEKFAGDVLDRAAREQASVVVFRLDTPGGLVSSMRGITTAILESKVPVVVWVSPSGARAASAGAFILQSAHVAAMAPGTNVGAAQPVMASGKDAPDTDMKKKITNDLSAQIRSLAQLRKRNADVAERMVSESLSITAEEALSLGVADLVASDMESLLLAIRGREVTAGSRTLFIDPPSGPPVEVTMSLREKILQFVSSPDIAYLLLTAGVLAIIFEVMSPGGFVLGTAGAVMVLLGAFGLRMLPFNWAGIILLFAGIAVLVLDLMVGGIGVLSLFGLAALVTGGLILFRAPGGELLNVSMSFIAGMSIALGLFFFAALFLILRSMKRKASSGREGMIGIEAEVVEDVAPVGLVKCRGEIWKARTGGNFIPKGRTGKVTAVRGMTLIIEEDGRKDLPAGDSLEKQEKGENS